MTDAQAFKTLKVGPGMQIMKHEERKDAEGGPLYSVEMIRYQAQFERRGWKVVSKPKPAPVEAKKTTRGKKVSDNA